MLLFVMLMGSLALALPLTGEIWRRGRDNIVIRSRDEAVQYLDVKLEKASVFVNYRLETILRRYEDAAVTLGLAAFLLKFVDKIIKYIARLLAG